MCTPTYFDFSFVGFSIIYSHHVILIDYVIRRKLSLILRFVKLSYTFLSNMYYYIILIICMFNRICGG